VDTNVDPKQHIHRGQLMPKLLTVKQVAELRNMSVSYVYKSAERGDIESFKFGSSLRFTEDHVNEYMRKSVNTAKEEIPK
jgi:putative molybdopterin biosynthesis protein